MKKKILKTVLIVGIVAVLTVGGIHIAERLLVKSASDSPDSVFRVGDTVQTFDDGSYIVDMGIDEYEHYLFGGHLIRDFDVTSQSLCLSDEYSSFDFSFKDKGTFCCIIEAYAFSENAAAIASHVFLLHSDETGKPGKEVIFNGSIFDLEREIYSLILLNSEKELLFPSFAELYAYCEDNGITLGETYHCVPFGSQPEHITELGDGYQLVDYPYDLSAIRYNHDNIYFGTIENVQTLDDRIEFDLTIPRTTHYPYSPDLCNTGLEIRSPDSFSQLQILFNKDDLFSGKIEINVSDAAAV